MKAALRIEPADSNDSGPCTCCGNMSRTVWGYLNDRHSTLAAYYVSWTLGRIDHGAHFDIVAGKWGEGATPQERSLVAVECRWMLNGPEFMVIDARQRPMANLEALASKALAREQVIGTWLAAQVFAMLDAIWLQDQRIEELTKALA